MLTLTTMSLARLADSLFGSSGNQMELQRTEINNEGSFQNLWKQSFAKGKTSHFLL